MCVCALQVMKYVAYCGGVMMKFRLEDPHGALAAAAPAAATPEGTPAPTQQSISWGLASTRPCAALANAAAAAQPPSSPPATSGPQLPTAQVTVGSSTANPTQSLSIENASRKPLYALCATVSTLKLSTDVSSHSCAQSISTAFLGLTLLTAASFGQARYGLSMGGDGAREFLVRLWFACRT